MREFSVLLEQGIDHFHLCDSEFNVPVSHAFDVCRAILHEGLGDKMRWYTYAAPMPFPADLAYLMKQAGCVGINFGIDSGSDRMLSALSRDFMAADIRHTATVFLSSMAILTWFLFWPLLVTLRVTKPHHAPA